VGGLQIWTSALLGAKNIGLFEIYGVSARTRGEGVEPVRTRGRGQFFTVLCGGPLWTSLIIILAELQ